MKFTFLPPGRAAARLSNECPVKAGQPLGMRQQMKAELQYYQDNQGFRIKSLKEKRKILALLFLMGVLFTVMPGFMLRRDYLRSNKWIDTPAIVMYSNVVSSYDSDGTMFRPHLEYTYSFNEKQYRGEWTREMGTSNRNSSEKFLNQHPLGSSLTIKVDPGNPGHSIVPVNDQWFWWLFIGVGSFLFGVAIYILIKYPAKSFKDSEVVPS